MYKKCSLGCVLTNSAALQWVELASPGLFGLEARTGIQDFLNMKQKYRLMKYRIRVAEIISNLKIKFLKIFVKP
jgi:hypothetical protein